MSDIIVLLAIYGIAFGIKQADGPWGICAKIRNVLIRNKYVGVFFHELFSCYYCLGFHSGWIAYLLNCHKTFEFNLFILWGFAGSAVSLIFDAALSKLYSAN
jgi:hypothetical protein